MHLPKILSHTFGLDFDSSKSIMHVYLQYVFRQYILSCHHIFRCCLHVSWNQIYGWSSITVVFFCESSPFILILVVTDIQPAAHLIITRKLLWFQGNSLEVHIYYDHNVLLAIDAVNLLRKHLIYMSVCSG